MPPTLVYYLIARLVAICCLEELLQLRLACSGTITFSHSFESSNLTSGSLWRKKFCIVFFVVSFCLYSTVCSMLEDFMLLLRVRSISAQFPEFRPIVEICQSKISFCGSVAPTAISFPNDWLNPYFSITGLVGLAENKIWNSGSSWLTCSTAHNQ